MSSLFTRLLCVACLTLAGAPSFAQEVGQSQELMRFAANNAEFDKRVETQAKRLFPKLFPACPGIQQAVRQLPTAYGTLVFPPVTEETNFAPPSDGLWIEHVKVRACEKILQINMLAIATQKGEPLLMALLPGETRSDPAAQRDTERIGAITISKADGGSCSDTATATTTRLIGYARPNAQGLSKTDTGNGWFEEWDYRFCQKTVAVQMAFVPNENGAIDVKARLADMAPPPQVPAAKPVTPAAKAP